jgi:hypothetical protein
MPALKRRPIFKAPLRGASTDGTIETGFPEGDLSFRVRSTRSNIDNYFFKVFTKRLIFDDDYWPAVVTPIARVPETGIPVTMVPIAMMPVRVMVVVARMRFGFLRQR